MKFCLGWFCSEINWSQLYFFMLRPLSPYPCCPDNHFSLFFLFLFLFSVFGQEVRSDFNHGRCTDMPLSIGSHLLHLPHSPPNNTVIWPQRVSSMCMSIHSQCIHTSRPTICVCVPGCQSAPWIYDSLNRLPMFVFGLEYGLVSECAFNL